MISSILLFVLCLLFLILALIILKLSHFQPWNTELWIQSQFRCLPWFATRLLFYLSMCLIIAPAPLFILLSLQFVEEGKDSIPCLAFVLIRIYAQIVIDQCEVFTKFSDKKLLHVGRVLKILLFWIAQIMLALRNIKFDYVCYGAIFMAIDFIFITRFIYTSSERDTINVSTLYKRFLRYYLEKSKSKPTQQIVIQPEEFKKSDLFPEIKINQIEANDDKKENDNDSPQIPEELPNESPNEVSKKEPEESSNEIPEEMPNENKEDSPEGEFKLDIPPIALEGVKTPEPSIPSVKIPKKFENANAFSTLCMSRVVQIELNYKAELDAILSEMKIEQHKCNFRLMLAQFFIGKLNLITYAFLCYFFSSDTEANHFGSFIFFFFLMFDSLVICWGNSKLHVVPIDCWKISLLLILARILMISGSYYWNYVHSIPVVIFGFILCISIRDYYLPLSPEKVECKYVYEGLLYKILGRFEVQFLLLEGMENVLILVHFLYDSTMGTHHFNTFIPLGTAINILPFALWERLYRKDNYTFTLLTEILILPIWGICTAYNIGALYISTSVSLLSIVTISFLSPPICFIIIIIFVDHWIKNDFNFYENLKPKEDTQEEDSVREELQASSISQPKNDIPQQLEMKKEDIEDCKQMQDLRDRKRRRYSISQIDNENVNFFMRIIPRTKNDTKILICMFWLLAIVVLTIPIYKLEMIGFGLYSIFMWFFSTIYCIFGIVGYIRRLYTTTLTGFATYFMSVFIVACWSWCAIMCKETFMMSEQHFYFTLISAVAFFFSFGFFFLSAYNFIDMGFSQSRIAIICLVIFFVIFNLWGIAGIILFPVDEFYHIYVLVTVSVVFFICLYILGKFTTYRTTSVITCIVAGVAIVGFIVASMLALIKGIVVGIYHIIFFGFATLLSWISGKLFELFHENRKVNFYREIASSTMFPIFRYNPDTMTMIPSHDLSSVIISALTIMLIWGLMISSFFPVEYVSYGIVGSCLSHIFTFLFVTNKISTSLHVPTEIFATLDSKDILLCIRRALPQRENGKMLEMNDENDKFIDLTAIINSAISQDTLRAWEIIKNVQMKVVGGICSQFIKQNVSDLAKLKEIKVTKQISDILTTLKAFNPEAKEVSYLEKLTNLKTIQDAIIDINYSKKIFYAALSVQIELASKLNKNKRVDVDKSKAMKLENSLQLDEFNLHTKELKRKDAFENVEFETGTFLDASFIEISFRKECTWIRAKHIVPSDYETVLFADDVVGDIKYIKFYMSCRQGEINDCWVIAAITILAIDAPECIRNMFNNEPIVKMEGKYSISLYCDGKKTSVEVDDYFPCFKGGKRVLCCEPIIDYTHKRKIIWPMLVEKAIAKVYEGYDNLEGGATDYALMLMTGNPAFRYNLLNSDIQMLIADNSLWRKIVDYSEKVFLLGAGTLPKDEMPFIQMLESSHAYAILDAFEFDGNKLLRVKDPWGMTYWCGDWSSNSEKWTNRMREYAVRRKSRRKEMRKKKQQLEQVDCKTLLPTLTNPNQRKSSFYISWEDFVKTFEVIFVSMHFDSSWSNHSFSDQWEIGRAGGSCDNIDTVSQNPQYLLEVDNRIEVYCLLTQITPPSQKVIPNIGFGIYKYHEKIVGINSIIPDLVAIGRYSMERSISLNTELAVGKYVLLLSTLQPGQYGKCNFTLWYPKCKDPMTIPIKITKLN